MGLRNEIVRTLGCFIKSAAQKWKRDQQQRGREKRMMRLCIDQPALFELFRNSETLAPRPCGALSIKNGWKKNGAHVIDADYTIHSMRQNKKKEEKTVGRDREIKRTL